MTKACEERKQGRAVRVTVDLCLAFVLVLIEATAFVDEAPHEWLGMAAFALTVIHVVLGRRRFKALARGRKTGGNVVRLLVDVLLIAAIIGQAASSIVLSEHALSWLPAVPGSFWARPMHLLCGYWSFELAFVHAGLNTGRLPQVIGANASLKWAACITVAVMALIGAVLFVSMDIPSYMFLQTQFAFVDLGTPLAVRFLQWLCIAALFFALSRSVVLLARTLAQGKR